MDCVQERELSAHYSAVRKRLMGVPPRKTEGPSLRTQLESLQSELARLRNQVSELRANGVRLAKELSDSLERERGALKLAERARVDAEIACDTAADVCRKQPKVSDIIGAVSAYYSITPLDLISERRTKDICIPRQVAIYLARTMTARSYPYIASRFGGRDHTTAMNGVARIKTLIEHNGDLRADIEAIRSHLEAAL